MAKAKCFNKEKFCAVLNQFKNQHPEFKKEELLSVLRENKLISCNLFWQVFKNSFIIRKTSNGWEFTRKGANDPFFLHEVVAVYKDYATLTKKYSVNHQKKKEDPRILALKAEIARLELEEHKLWAKILREERGWVVLNEQGFPII